MTVSNMSYAKLLNLVNNQETTLIKKTTSLDRARNAIKLEIAKSRVNLESEELLLHTVRERHAALKYKAEATTLILNGAPGFLLVEQDNKYEIQSGFTAFEEVCHFFVDASFKASLFEPKLDRGWELYRVSSNGILTFVDAKRDSSD